MTLPLTTPVNASMVRALVDEAKAADHTSGVIGMRGDPDEETAADLVHDDQVVRVRTAASALAVREVLAQRGEEDWLVVVTDRADDDLGAGILAHFVWQRLRNPDPWKAVRYRFAANGVDPTLTVGPHSRDLAVALLAATPPQGWPASPAGVLTRAHALAAVAQAHLDLDLDADVLDLLSVLVWTMRPHSVAAVADLRRELGDLLADETLDWIADCAAAAAEPVRALLRGGEMGDVVPLGVVLQLLGTSQDEPSQAHVAQLALARLEPRWGSRAPTPHSLQALGSGCTALLAELVRTDEDRLRVDRVLARADAITEQIKAESLSIASDLLPRALRARLLVLAKALRRVVDPAPGPQALCHVERAWATAQDHRLASSNDALLRPFAAAVRLVRWLGSPGVVPGHSAVPELAARVRQHLDHAAWADAAINDAFVGVDDAELSSALRAVIAAAQARRREQERAFAAALAQVTADGATTDGVLSQEGTAWYLERLLPKVVLPMARKAPVLLLVMDGMSAATATELLTDAVDRLGWVEAALPRTTGRRRSAALAVLPSLTEVSRASLLSGRLVQGQQDLERKGYQQLTTQTGRVRATLFHKKGVDTTAAGSSVSADLGAALDDAEVALVTVVLNTIDDALDRSDPAGTTWTADAVKHLEPLLARARTAARTVIITADHGHVVERRAGTQRSYDAITSSRSRPATGSNEDGEVAVTGSRVLTANHRAVLAVDEGLRYGPLKAGYHGGASAAEVVVPVAVLLPDEDAASNPMALALLPPQQPDWWFPQNTRTATAQTESAPAAAPRRVGRSTQAGDLGLLLFDQVPQAASPPATVVDEAPGLGHSVVGSAVYRAQRKVAGRLTVVDDQVAALVDALAAAADHRLPRLLAARVLSLNETRLPGALAQVQQLLNVEGYAVLAVDAATGAVIVDEQLMREQFEVG